MICVMSQLFCFCSTSAKSKTTHNIQITQSLFQGKRFIIISMKKLLITSIIVFFSICAVFAAPSFEKYFSPSSIQYSSSTQESAANAASLTEMLYALGNLYSYLDQNYLYEIDNDSMKNAVISAMIDSLGDKYSYFVTPDEAEDYKEDSDGKYVGIGTYLTKVNPAYIDWEDPSTYMVIITSPFPGGPADRAGLRAGDMISHVNGEEIYELNATDASKKIRGEAGTSITLTVHRGSATFDITLMPEEITTPTTSKTILDGDIGYLAITQFSKTTYDSVKEDLSTLLEEGATSLIIDLRNNGGGVVDSALSIANMFVEGDKVLMTTKFKESASKKNTTYTSTDQLSVPLSFPIVLLVNGGTASASEILTGALRDNDRAIVVGSQTYGKGIMQYSISFMGGYLNLTVANYYTPSGKSIHEIGITPDFVVETSEYTDEELSAYAEFLKESYMKNWLADYPEYSKENILAFAEKYQDSGVPHDLLCLLIRNEYIYSLNYDERPVADPDFDTQLSKAIEVIRSEISVTDLDIQKEEGL